jgi:hypothetical protein
MEEDDPGNNNNRGLEVDVQRKETMVQRARSEFAKLRERILGKKIVKNRGTGEIRIRSI